MNTMTVENSGTAVEESSPSYQEIHIFFKDLYQGDHHLRLFVGQGDDDDQTKAEAKAKAKHQLEHKDVDVLSVTVMTQEEYEQSPRSKHQIFYIVYQNGNGRRRQLSILATDEAEAEEIFNRRVSGIFSIQVFSRLEFKPMLETGYWKNCPLSTTSQN